MVAVLYLRDPRNQDFPRERPSRGPGLQTVRGTRALESSEMPRTRPREARNEVELSAKAVAKDAAARAGQ